MRIYERGVWGETLAYGTGSCAAVAVAYLTGRIKSRKAMMITKSEYRFQVELVDDTLFLTGSAERAFKGEVELRI